MQRPVSMSDTKLPTWNDVRQLADELELKIHLASMEARDRWHELQPRLVELERAIEDQGQRAGQALSEQLTALGKALQELAAELADELRDIRRTRQQARQNV